MTIQGIFKNADLIAGKDAVYITDTNVYSFYKDCFNEKRTIVIEAGEKSKDWSTISYIVDQLLINNASRKTFLVGVGGGVVTDITGFVASIYMRGIDFGFISTSLLGMVDASIGGKNGIDFGGYKNMIGTFRMPAFVYYSVDFLDTLPKEEMRNGFGEILKYGIGFSKTLFMKLYNTSFDELIQDKLALAACISQCVSIKEKIVKFDMLEESQRKHLNLGHTFAHAIERYTDYKMPHGMAVGKGLWAITEYSYSNNYINKDEHDKIVELLNNYGFVDANTKSLVDISKNYIEHDKKSDKDFIDLIVLDTIGVCSTAKVKIQELNPEAISLNY